MTPLEIAAPAACIVIALTVSVVTLGLRGGLAAFAVAGARVGMIAIAAQLARWLGGDIAAWCSLPLSIAAAWFGDSPLGILNFLYLQWLGVRLARVTVPGLFTAVAIGNVRAGQAVTERDINMRTVKPVVRWSLLRWVWPLTGWWSPRRWIARRW